MTKAIILDIGNVLIQCDYSRAFNALAKHCALEPKAISDAIAQSGIYPDFERGQISAEEFFHRTSVLLNADLPFERFSAIWCDIFPEQPLQPPEWLHDISQRAPLYALSDNNTLHWPHVIRAFPMLRHFRDQALSFRVGATKPSALMFEAAIKMAGCRPEECFFVDDVLANVLGAREAGIRAVQYQSPPQLQHEVESAIS
jgi:FMN phosphatase YigB (HAD superfamily)